MKPKSTLSQTFGQTTISLQEVQAYLNSDPGYLASSVACGDDVYKRMEANHADYVEFWLRRYVAGESRTLHRLFAEVRAFLAFDEALAHEVIPLLMEYSVRQTLLEREWYEWLPRYERARQRIHDTFGITLDQE